MSVKEKIFMSRVADQSERYKDMVDFLEQVLDAKTEDLNSEERNLLSVGFKNLISANRSAWRTITAIEQNEKYAEYSDDCKTYKGKIESELEGQCKKIIKMVNDK